jgi:hypothetical protein
LNSSAINQYMNPYTQDVTAQESALLNQQNQTAQSGQLGTAISSGAFGGDRSGVAAANLAGQQSLAYGNAMAPILQQGYNTALSTAQQQQGVTLAAQQADAARLSAAGQQIANIGTQGQTAGLAGAQAQMAAGQVGQQTTQAGDTALYNQFLQQQSYPFQTAQFMANIAEGTGALSGQTTTTTQPSSFFSDRRLKENIKKIGTAKNGLPIYSFNYKEDPEKISRLGFMADEVEKKHPEAVGLAGGFKTVDYEKAARPKRYAGGLLADSTGGLVTDHSRGGFDQGGSPGDWTAILQQHEGMYGPQAGGLYGGSAQATPGKPSYVPSSSVPQHQPLRPGNIPALPQSGLKQAIGDATQAENLYKMGTDPKGLGAAVYNKVAGTPAAPLDLHPTPAAPPPANPVIPDPNATDSSTPAPGNARGGFLRARGGLADGGDPEGLYQTPGAGLSIPNENQTAQNLSEQKAEAPQSSGSSSGDGLGDALKLAGLVLPFFKFADGGLVRRRREDGGPVAEDLEFARGGLADGGDPDVVADPTGGATLDAAGGVGSSGLAPSKIGLEKLRAALESQPIDNPQPPRRPEGLGLAAATPAEDTHEQVGNPAAPAPAEQAIAQAAPSAAPVAGFGNALGFTFQHEGGLNPSDSNGSPSNFGINQAAHPGVDVTKLSKDQAASIYKNEYWNAIGGDKLPPALQTMAFDTAVMSGPGKAKELIAASGGDPDKFMQLRQDFQDHLLASNPDKYGKYAPAWTQRNQDLSGGGGGGGDSAGAGLAGGIQRFAQNAGQTISDAGSGLGKSVTQGGQKAGDWYGQNQNWLGPLLQGLGTMASSNSRYLGSAVLQGLGGGAESYAKQQANQANIGQTQASTGLTNTETAQRNLELSQKGFFSAGGQDWVTTQDGQKMLLGAWLSTPAGQRPHLIGEAALSKSVGNLTQPGAPPGVPAGVPIPGAQAPGASSLPGPSQPLAGALRTDPVTGAPIATTTAASTISAQPTYAHLGSAGQSQLDSDFHTLQMNPGVAARNVPISQAVEAQTADNYNKAVSTGQQLNQLTTQLQNLPENSVLSGGPLQAYTSFWLNRANAALHAAGVGDAVSQEDLDSGAAANKLTKGFEFARTHNASQNSLGALGEVSQAVPSTSLTKGAASKVLAGEYVNKQQDIDRMNYLNEAKKSLAAKYPAQADKYLTQNIMQAFNADHNGQQYASEKVALEKMLNGKNAKGPIFNQLLTGPASHFDTVEQKLQTPGLRRYLLNN